MKAKKSRIKIKNKIENKKPFFGYKKLKIVPPPPLILSFVSKPVFVPKNS